MAPPGIRFSMGRSALVLAAIAAVFGMFAGLSRDPYDGGRARYFGFYVLGSIGAISYFRCIGSRAVTFQIVITSGMLCLALPILGRWATSGISPRVPLISALVAWLLVEILASGLEMDDRIRLGVVFVRRSILFAAIELFVAFGLFAGLNPIRSH